MKRFARIFLMIVALCAGCSKNSLQSPGEFTKAYVDVLHAAAPDLEIRINKDLDLTVKPPKGSEFQCYLDNAYTTYKGDPQSEKAVIIRYSSVVLEIVKSSKVAFDRTRIVPTIKDRAWLDEIRQLATAKSAKAAGSLVYENFVGDLMIVYAEDSEKTVKFLTTERLEEGKIARNDLRALACSNLENILPKFERKGDNGVFILNVGGSYEASLMLLDSVWEKMKPEVKGDIVVAVPNRDLILVTGAIDAEGIAAVKQIAKKSAAEGPYRLTTQLFVRRDGKFTEFDQ